MHEQLKKQPKLSVKMQLFKDNIQNLIHERKSLMEHVYEESKFASVVAAGINKTFNVLAAFLSSFAAIPLIGNVFQTLAAIPEGLVYFADPKRTLKEKMIAVLGIAVVAGIAVTAFALGTTATLIFSTIVAFTFAIGEGINAVSKIIEDNNASSAYSKKAEFVQLLETGNVPVNDYFNELLEIRAIELQHEIDKPGVRNNIRKKMNDELHFIEDELNKRNIIAGKNRDNQAFELAQLYAIHQEQIEALAATLALITEEIDLEGSEEVLHEIQKIQNEILTTEEDIISITQPIELLQFQKEITGPKVAVSLTTFTTTIVSAIISIFALLIGMGVLVAPPILLPITIGIGITLAIVGLGRWIAEKMVEQQEKSYKNQSELHKKDVILNKALIAYEHKNNLGKTASVENSSHTKHMSELLTESTPTPAIIDATPHKDEFTLFSRKKADSKEKTLQASVEIEPDASETPTITATK